MRTATSTTIYNKLYRNDEGREGGTYRSVSRLSAYMRTATSTTIYNKVYRNDGGREGGREGFKHGSLVNGHLIYQM
jgi:hypothetical protein